MKPLTPATQLHAKPSAQFAEKLAATQAQLKSAAAELQPLKQASSLGAEDVVITHILNSLQLDIPVFVLETGALHATLWHCWNACKPIHAHPFRCSNPSTKPCWPL
jgi:3'-phosphoadenosine 5'-phosphosulfate sulfotransferase (PAPS reductase)/FAD synthetase